MNANIFIEFQKGLLSDEEMLELQKSTESICPIGFQPKDTHVLAAFEDIISAVTVYITPDFWTQLYAGLATNVISSGIIFAITQIKKAIQKKRVYKVTADGADEKIPTIGIRTHHVNIILPTDISDDKFEYCVDRAFESVQDSKQLILKEETITFFDKEIDSMVTYSIKEYYDKNVEPHYPNDK